MYLFYFFKFYFNLWNGPQKDSQLFNLNKLPVWMSMPCLGNLTFNSIILCLSGTFVSSFDSSCSNFLCKTLLLKNKVILLSIQRCTSHMYRKFLFLDIHVTLTRKSFFIHMSTLCSRQNYFVVRRPSIQLLHMVKFDKAWQGCSCHEALTKLF